MIAFLYEIVKQKSKMIFHNFIFGFINFIKSLPRQICLETDILNRNLTVLFFFQESAIARHGAIALNAVQKG